MESPLDKVDLIFSGHQRCIEYQVCLPVSCSTFASVALLSKTE